MKTFTVRYEHEHERNLNDELTICNPGSNSDVSVGKGSAGGNAFSSTEVGAGVDSGEPRRSAGAGECCGEPAGWDASAMRQTTLG